MDFPKHYETIAARMKKLGAELPGPMGAFGTLHRTAVADGALDTKTKELIALAIGIAVRCDGCIAYHVHDALVARSSREEVIETIGVAVLMGGGPSVVYGTEALEALDQFEKAALKKAV
jgi:AhpD family alkylhydroperoxidase